MQFPPQQWHHPEDDPSIDLQDIPLINQTPEALKNEDILYLIFEYFHLQPGSQTIAQNRQDLLSIAKACKYFTEPALNLIWRVLPSLLPLLLLLPSAEVINGQYFVDNLPFNNWKRFEMHARRVRTLYMETSQVIISPLTYLHIRSMCDRPLLPNLKAIYIPNNKSIDFPSIMLLALGALDTVEINDTAISERSFFIPFLTLLAFKSPQLRHLALHGSGNISLEPVYRLKSLQRLEIRLPGTYLYPQTLQKLGNMVNLQDLTLNVGTPAPVSVIDTGIPPLPSSSRNFGSLKRLHIIGIPSSITRVLDVINLASLTTLVVDETTINPWDETESFWRRCFDQISICHTIKHFRIDQSNHREGYEHFCLSTSWFSSFLNLKNIRSLVINGSALSGSDEDFRLLADAFPKLTKLVVPSRYHSQGRTLACLSFFAHGCPELREIKICLAFNIRKNLEALRDPRVPLTFVLQNQHPLEKLYINSEFGQIKLNHTVKVAQFLDFIFPKLSILKTYNSDATETANWTGIQQFRAALQAARIDGFNQAMSELGMEPGSLD